MDKCGKLFAKGFKFLEEYADLILYNNSEEADEFFITISEHENAMVKIFERNYTNCRLFKYLIKTHAKELSKVKRIFILLFSNQEYAKTDRDVTSNFVQITITISKEFSS
jgi:hypothetical protein